MAKGRPKKAGAREANGKLQRPSRRDEEKAMRQTLMTRAIQSGLIEMRPVPTKAAHSLGMKAPEDVLAAMKQPWMGCHAGRAIAFDPEVSDLWETIKLVRQRRNAWLRSIDAPAEFGKCANVQVTPSKEEAFGDLPPTDIRTAEEKARDAEAIWNATASKMSGVNPLLQRAICLDERVKGDLLGWIKALRRALA